MSSRGHAPYLITLSYLCDLQKRYFLGQIEDLELYWGYGSLNAIIAKNTTIRKSAPAI